MKEYFFAVDDGGFHGIYRTRDIRSVRSYSSGVRIVMDGNVILTTNSYDLAGFAENVFESSDILELMAEAE